METRSDNRVVRVYEALLAHYGPQHWWPAETPYEVIVGTILTQNTAWVNVEKAIANFGSELRPEAVATMNPDRLKELIRPAGFFNQKASYLQTVTGWFARYGYDAQIIRQVEPGRLRTELLSLRGVGPETADSILLYAFGFPSFVVDAYTMRLCARYPFEVGKDYERVKAFFERRLPVSAAVYNSLHALIVIHAKAYCRRKPLCEDCPLAQRCERQGT